MRLLPEGRKELICRLLFATDLNSQLWNSITLSFPLAYAWLTSRSHFTPLEATGNPRQELRDRQRRVRQVVLIAAGRTEEASAGDPSASRPRNNSICVGHC